MYRNESDDFNDLCIDLTPKECETLQFLIQGEAHKEIAKHMGISRQMVAQHVRSIMKKTNTPNSLSAVVVLIRRGLI
ncbi:MAG: helix-turn-helix transcriptional regulator [Anaerolineaceae bacterium]